MTMSGRDVFVIADNVFSPLGKTTAENFSGLKQNRSAVKPYQYRSQAYCASLFDIGEFPASQTGYTKFEQLLIASIQNALGLSGLSALDEKTVLIISSTKGNIGLLETEPVTPALHERIGLSTSAELVAEYFGFQHKPIVISNACVSGVVAILAGMRMLRSGQFEHAVIAGAELVSEFIVSGFQSFQALSPQQCRPFDKNRDGLNLGEGAATIILSSDKKYEGAIKVLGGGISNDANHISGPSRTGQELANAIEVALKDARFSAGDIDFISAHGTATQYNDEMEANAIALAGLESVPLNSLKGYYGHTLGAAGILESVISIQSLKGNFFFATPGFEETGVTKPVNVSAGAFQIPAKNLLKTASGFGGCNAAVVFGK